MKKIFAVILLATMSCQLSAQSINETAAIKVLEEKYSVLLDKQANTEYNLRKLKNLQKEIEHKMQTLGSENLRQGEMIDSLQNACKQLAATQLAEREEINRKISETNSHLQASQALLQSRTFWVFVTAIALLILIVGVTFRLTKRIKSGSTSIDEVRKAQEALQSVQIKMQEESVKLDDKLLKLFEQQISDSSNVIGSNKPDHSLALKVADEIVRIELNMSRMDSSVKGYKQLAKAVERIKDNFKANGYEIVDMLGEPYNEGMKVTANFVADENLEAGKQIITGITKPQINYNGQMIQAAQITVSQNI